MQNTSQPDPGIPPSGQEPHPPRRSLVPQLLSALLLLLCLTAGLALSPLVSAHELFRPHTASADSDLGEEIARWRRSVYRPEDDPRLGAPAPALGLRAERGRKFELADLAGGGAAIVFLGSGEG